MEKRKFTNRIPLIIDSNIIIASMRSRGITRKIFFSAKLQKCFNLITLDFCFEEIWKYRNRWNTLNLPDDDLIKILDFFFKEKVQIYSTGIIQPQILKSYEIMKHIDEKDTPILALALSTQGIIWSNDSHLKKQKKVICFNTKELKKLLKINNNGV